MTDRELLEAAAKAAGMMTYHQNRIERLKATLAGEAA
jgi:hypothetical protein